MRVSHVQAQSGRDGVLHDRGRVIRERIWRRLFARNLGRLDQEIRVVRGQVAKGGSLEPVARILHDCCRSALAISSAARHPMPAECNDPVVEETGASRGPIEGAMVRGTMESVLEAALRGDSRRSLLALAGLVHRTTAELRLH